MASVGEFLVAWANLPGQADLSALIADRFSPWTAGRKVLLPRVVYAVISGESIQTLTRPSSLRRTEVQVEAQAATNLGARAVAEKLIGDPDANDLRLDGYAGTLGGLVVQGCHLNLETEQYDEPTTSPDAVGVHRIILTFVVWHKFA